MDECNTPSDSDHRAEARETVLLEEESRTVDSTSEIGVRLAARVCVCARVYTVCCKWEPQTLGTGKLPCLNVVCCYKFILDLILSVK